MSQEEELQRLDKKKPTGFEVVKEEVIKSWNVKKLEDHRRKR